jgi:hypothetical protein
MIDFMFAFSFYILHFTFYIPMHSLRLPSALLFVTLSLAACGSQPVVTPDKTASQRIVEYNSITGKQNETSPSHGAQTRFWYGAMVGVNDIPANGVGVLRQYADKTFAGQINLNVLPRKDDKHLVVWMAKSGGTDPVRVGELTSIIGDARHALSFETTEDLSERTAVLVTLETIAEPPSPGPHAAEGMLKEVVKK